MAELSVKIPDCDDEAMADELERIGGMIRDGFTSGETICAGWWNVKDLAQLPDLETEESDR